MMAEPSGVGRSMVRAVTIIAVALTLASCSSSSDGTGPPEPTGSSTSAVVPTDGSTTRGSVDSSAATDTAGDPDSIVTSDPIPTTPADLSSTGCDVEPASLADDWPFAVSPAMTVVGGAVSGLTYRAYGVTDNADEVLADTMDLSFAGYEASEPEGSDTDVSIDFDADGGSATLHLDDADRDGCWSVDLLAVYVQAPTAAPSATAEPDVVDPLDDLSGVGTGTATTARGTFALTATVCSFSPLDVEATSSEGSVRITGTPPDSVVMDWTYRDGVEVDDDHAHVLALDAGSGAFVANGHNDEGPESVIVELTC